MISGLKNLTVQNLGNLTPHPYPYFYPTAIHLFLIELNDYKTLKFSGFRLQIRSHQAIKNSIKIDIKLKSINFKFLNILFLLTSLFSQNTQPIFLIHGFFGWGRDEMNGYYYWGGEQDFQEKLRGFGYEVYTLSVGPVSSNWDRAIEAYTQIKGGCINYGRSHSEKI